jgi:hypothetical protein
MRLGASIGSLWPRQWTQRSVPWVGGLFIAVIAAMAAYDIVRSYQATISNTGHELDSQARVIAEQTARSVQAVDVVLRQSRGAVSQRDARGAEPTRST